MGFEGRLDTVSFGDILNTLCNISKEGVLIIQDDKQRKVIHFRDNGMTLIGGSQRIRLGDMILQAGKIKDWELENALQEQADSNKMLGEILVEQGIITEEDLEEMICDQIEQEICDIFFWENPYFSFQEGPPKDELTATSEDSPITLMFDVQSVLLRIADQIGEWEEIRKDIPSFTKIFLVVSEDIEITLPEGESEDNLQKIVLHLDGTHEVSDIIRLTELSTMIVCRILSFLLREGVIREAYYEELTQIAEDFLERGQVQRSIAFLEKALLLHPSDATLLLKIAQSYETIGGKKAGEYYAKLAAITSDPKVAIRYYESSISYQPKAIEPREKILELAEYLDSEKKEIHHSRMLARMYQQEGAYDKAVAICRNYLEKYPRDLDLRHILISGYLQREQTQEAIEEYEKVSDVLEQMGNLKSCLENLQKIVDLDPSREDVKKRVKRLQSVMKWTGKRNVLIAGITIGILLLASLGYAGFYELSARKLFESAQELKRSDSQKSMETFGEIVNKYKYSSVATKAEQELVQLKQTKTNGRQKPGDGSRIAKLKKTLEKELERVDRLVEQKKMDKALMYLAQCERRYEKYPELHEKIISKRRSMNQSIKDRRPKHLVKLIDSIKNNCKKENLNTAVQDYKKLREIIQSSGLKEYEEYETESRKEIQELAENLLKKSQAKIEMAYSIGRENEKNGESYVLSKNKYKEALQEYNKTTQLRLPPKTNRISMLWEKIENRQQNAKKRLEQLERWEREASEKLQNARILEKDEQIDEAFKEILEIFHDSRLAKTEIFKERGFLPYRIETSPPGATIEGTDGKTPYMLSVKPDGLVVLTLHYPGFSPRKVTIAYNHYLFDIDTQSQNILNDGKIPEELRERLEEQGINFTNDVHVQTKNISSKWLIEVDGNKFIVSKDFKRKGKVLNVYRTCDPISKFSFNKKDMWRYPAKNANRQEKLGGIVGRVRSYRGKLFVTSRANKIVALDAKTGEKFWTFEGKRLGSMVGGVGIYKSTVYAGSSDQYLYAVDMDDGTEKWKFNAKDFIAVAPRVEQKSVYFATKRQGIVYSLDRRNKKELWKYKTNPREGVEASPLLWSKYLLVATKKGRLIILNLTNGKEVWKRKLGSGIVTNPMVKEKFCFVGTTDGELYCIDLEKISNGEKKLNRAVNWLQPLDGGIEGAITISSEYVYVGTKNGYFYKLDRLSGDQHWKKKFPDSVNAKSVVLEDAVYVPCMDGVLYLCNVWSGDVTWQRKYSKKGLRSDLVLKNGIIYLGTEDGVLYALPGN